MSDMSMFFASAAAVTETEEVYVSDRFKGPDGNPIAWIVKPISEEENEEILKSATRKVKGKHGVYTSETNNTEYMSKLAVACVTYPNLDDAELQKSYGVRGADVLIRKMLLPGEYSNLFMKIQEINGFDKDINDLKEEVKN